MLNKTLMQLTKYLEKNQQKNGSFLGFSSSDEKHFKNPKKYESIFFSALILVILCEVDEASELKSLKEKVSQFLLTQKNPHWSFNYWTRNSPEAKNTPYPDDLDDTFCALSALLKYDEKLIDGEVVAKAVNLLTAVEMSEGGPYKTWLVPETADEAWKDVDLAVNSNVAYFLSLLEVDLPNIISLVESAVDKGKYHSPYYAGGLPVIYFISRFYKSDKKKKIVSHLYGLQKSNGGWGSPLNTSLAVTSLINLGENPTKLKSAIDFLIDNKKKIHLPYPFVVELIKGKVKYYSGSPTLTTVVCMQAISKYKKSLDKQKLNIKSQVKNKSSVLHKKIITKIQKRFSELDGDLKNLSLAQLKKTLKVDQSHPIALLPNMFADSLIDKSDQIDKEVLINLGMANIYGWMAYTIYDDFLDDEGDPKNLSVANVCLRELGQIYIDNPLYHPVMDKLDSANAWEVSHCRANPKKILKEKIILPNYEDYSRLADRSLGHALGPLTILLEAGYSPGSKEVKSLMRFFRHYLIARQLNDDMHDWEDDLKMGHINAVGSILLKNYHQNYINKKKNHSMEKLQEIFWNEEIVPTSKISYIHIDLARKEIKKLSKIFDPKILEVMMEKVEGVVDEVLEEREKTLEFIKNYSS